MGWLSDEYQRRRGMSALFVVFFLKAALPASAAGEPVEYSKAARAGTIIVHTSKRKLYLALGKGRALRYSVGVGRPDRQWHGRSAIEGKFIRPNWAPPDAIRRDHPHLPAVIPGGAGNNPMGAAALTLLGGSYAIHGTNRPASIGGFVSYGCIRMQNADILELYDRVEVGTPVLVVP